MRAPGGWSVGWGGRTDPWPPVQDAEALRGGECSSLLGCTQRFRSLLKLGDEVTHNTQVFVDGPKGARVGGPLHVAAAPQIPARTGEEDEIRQEREVAVPDEGVHDKAVGDDRHRLGPRRWFFSVFEP